MREKLRWVGQHFANVYFCFAITTIILLVMFK